VMFSVGAVPVKVISTLPTPLFTPNRDGLLALSILPCTINICVAQTLAAGGNMGTAIFNAIFANVLGEGFLNNFYFLSHSLFHPLCHRPYLSPPFYSLPSFLPPRPLPSPFLSSSLLHLFLTLFLSPPHLPH
jgi:hypothetical protein